jgi:hypothetical protein
MLVQSPPRLPSAPADGGHRRYAAAVPAASPITARLLLPQCFPAPI